MNKQTKKGGEQFDIVNFFSSTVNLLPPCFEMDASILLLTDQFTISKL